MALGSQRSALRLQRDEPRSCVSRIYYSAYQAVTAVLLYHGCVPPTDREAWNHIVTPDLIVEQLQSYIPKLDRRKDLANRLSALYKLRVSADYIGSNVIDSSTVQKAMKDGNFLIKNAEKILSGA